MKIFRFPKYENLWRRERWLSYFWKGDAIIESMDLFGYCNGLCNNKLGIDFMWMEEIRRQLGEFISSPRNRFSLGRVDGKAWENIGKGIYIHRGNIGIYFWSIGNLDSKATWKDF